MHAWASRRSVWFRTRAISSGAEKPGILPRSTTPRDNRTRPASSAAVHLDLDDLHPHSSATDPSRPPGHPCARSTPEARVSSSRIGLPRSGAGFNGTQGAHAATPRNAAAASGPFGMTMATRVECEAPRDSRRLARSGSAPRGPRTSGAGGRSEEGRGIRPLECPVAQQ